MSTIRVGSSPSELEGWESLLVHFNHFESMPSKKGHLVESPLFRFFNREWRLQIYPGGHINASDGSIALYLRQCSGPKITAMLIFIIRDASGKVIRDFTSRYITFEEGIIAEWGRSDYHERAKIIDPSNNILNHGTLTVEVRIKPHEDHYCLNFIPKNALAQNMLESFNDENTADVLFEVKGQDESSTSALLYAHKLVLQLCVKGSFLASLCEDCDKSTPVPISGIDPQVFRKMLHYVYGGSIDDAEWKDHSQDYIDAADIYGVKNLKIEAEAWYVKHLELEVDNVIDALLYADEKNCFLLKEEAMSFILKNVTEVLASDSFEKIPESKSIIREILSLVAMNIHGDGDEEKLSINELRAKLSDEGKGIDGPRNMLIAQLQSEKK